MKTANATIYNKLLQYGVPLFLAFVLIFLSTWRLAYSPATWFDEGINLGIAKEFAATGIFSLPVSPTEVVATRQFLITTNYPVLLPVALALKLGGVSFVSARCIMVLFLWAFVALVYILAKRESGSREAALWSAALVIVFTPFYGNGKDVLGEVPGLVYFLAGILLLPKNLNWKKLCIAGILFGLAAATKPFFLIVGVALLAGEWYHYRTTRLLLNRLLLLGPGALLPLLGWLYSILPSVSLAGVKSMVGFYANSYAASSFITLVLHNILRFVTESTPLHFTVLFAVSVFAWVKIWRKNKIPLSEAKVIIATFIIVNILWYLKTPGWYRYFFTAHVLLFLWFPDAIFKLCKRKYALLCLVLLLAIQTVILVSKRKDPLYYTTETTDMAAVINLATTPNDSILFINAPSTAFVVPARQSYQFLQINPALYFGRASLTDSGGKPYKALVVPRDLSTTALAPFEEVIEKEYTLYKVVGHFSLYVRL